MINNIIFGLLYIWNLEITRYEKIPKMIQGTTLPWAHDNSSQNVWTKWDVQLRDLYILNEEGILYDMINLTAYDPDPQINDGNNYNDLKQLILDAKKASSPN